MLVLRLARYDHLPQPTPAEACRLAFVRGRVAVACPVSRARAVGAGESREEGL